MSCDTATEDVAGPPIAWISFIKIWRWRNGAGSQDQFTFRIWLVDFRRLSKETYIVTVLGSAVLVSVAAVVTGAAVSVMDVVTVPA